MMRRVTQFLASCILILGATGLSRPAAPAPIAIPHVPILGYCDDYAADGSYSKAQCCADIADVYARADASVSEAMDGYAALGMQWLQNDCPNHPDDGSNIGNYCWNLSQLMREQMALVVGRQANVQDVHEYFEPTGCDSSSSGGGGGGGSGTGDDPWDCYDVYLVYEDGHEEYLGTTCAMT